MTQVKGMHDISSVCDADVMPNILCTGGVGCGTKHWLMCGMFE